LKIIFCYFCGRVFKLLINKFMHKKTYIKVSSYEAKEGTINKVLLLYSGGLDTSIMVKWIKDEYKAEIVALTLDVGQQRDNMEEVRQKALKLGAIEAIALDIKEEFAKEYISKGIKANACYQGDYHLSTPIGRAIMAQKAVEIANKVGADCIAHGSTGKGNDQVRFEAYILACDPKMKIIAPVREWDMDRDEEIAYAQKNNIPVPVTKKSPYSVDDNMWGMTWEGAEIEEPDMIPQIENFLKTYTLPKNAPSKAEYIKLDFEKGIPTCINGKKMSLAKLIIKLNKIGGKHGVGIVHLLEDRLVGLKNRGVYEQPAGHIIVNAHKVLENYVSTRQLNEIKSTLDIKWGYLCYGAQWYDPSMQAIDAFNDFVNEKVTGQVTVKLYKGNVDIVALKSPFGLGHVSFAKSGGSKFNVNASAGFIEIYSLQMKLANQLVKKNKKK
jgi:argininosuccinate synthase